MRRAAWDKANGDSDILSIFDTVIGLWFIFDYINTFIIDVVGKCWRIPLYNQLFIFSKYKYILIKTIDDGFGNFLKSILVKVCPSHIHSPDSILSEHRW